MVTMHKHHGSASIFEMGEDVAQHLQHDPGATGPGQQTQAGHIGGR